MGAGRGAGRRRGPAGAALGPAGAPGSRAAGPARRRPGLDSQAARKRRRLRIPPARPPAQAQLGSARPLVRPPPEPPPPLLPADCPAVARPAGKPSPALAARTTTPRRHRAASEDLAHSLPGSRLQPERGGPGELRSAPPRPPGLPRAPAAAPRSTARPDRRARTPGRLPPPQPQAPRAHPVRLQTRGRRGSLHARPHARAPAPAPGTMRDTGTSRASSSCSFIHTTDGAGSAPGPGTRLSQRTQTGRQSESGGGAAVRPRGRCCRSAPGRTPRPPPCGRRTSGR